MFIKSEKPPDSPYTLDIKLYLRLICLVIWHEPKAIDKEIVKLANNSSAQCGVCLLVVGLVLNSMIPIITSAARRIDTITVTGKMKKYHRRFCFLLVATSMRSKTE